MARSGITFVISPNINDLAHHVQLQEQRNLKNLHASIRLLLFQIPEYFSRTRETYQINANMLPSKEAYGGMGVLRQRGHGRRRRHGLPAVRHVRRQPVVPRRRSPARVAEHQRELERCGQRGGRRLARARGDVGGGVVQRQHSDRGDGEGGVGRAVHDVEHQHGDPRGQEQDEVTARSGGAGGVLGAGWRRLAGAGHGWPGSPGGVGSSWAQAGRGSRGIGRRVCLILGAVAVERREREEKGGERGRVGEAGGGSQRKEARAARLGLGGSCLLGLGPLVRLGFSFFLFLFFYFLFLNLKYIFK
jgi:hypothetical protein